MGIGFNATFLVQIFHFFVAYYLFSRLLFKPAIAIIDQESANLSQLYELIERDKQQLEERRNAQRRQWLAARNYFKQYTPAPDGIKARMPLPPLAYSFPAQAKIQEQSQELAALIVARLENQ